MANNVVIVADDPLARAGLGAILAGQATLTVAGQTGSADLAAAQRAFLPDVIVWDLGWEPERRIDALSSFTDGAETPVVALLATPTAAPTVPTSIGMTMLDALIVIMRKPSASP